MHDAHAQVRRPRPAASVAREWHTGWRCSNEPACPCYNAPKAAAELPESAGERSAAWYQVSLVRGLFTPQTESLLLDHLLTKPDGIYYLYSKPLGTPPIEFKTRLASWYLAALEPLAGFGQRWCLLPTLGLLAEGGKPRVGLHAEGLCAAG